jgi:SAM-dependent methyltransferase
MSNKRFEGVDVSRTFRHICEAFGLKQKSVLDIGCGMGQYLRHFGAGSLGVTTAEVEVAFGKAEGLPIAFGNAEYLEETLSGRKFEAFWANNLFEHLLSPHAFLMKLKRIAVDDSLLILGVPMIPKMVSLTRLSKFRGMLASNHINFFTAESFKLTVERAGWQVLALRPFIFRNRFLDRLARPFAPHLYVVARNDARFAYPPKKVAEWKDDPRYDYLLSITHQDGR